MQQPNGRPGAVGAAETIAVTLCHCSTHPLRHLTRLPRMLTAIPSIQHLQCVVHLTPHHTTQTERRRDEPTAAAQAPRSKRTPAAASPSSAAQPAAQRWRRKTRADEWKKEEMGKEKNQWDGRWGAVGTTSCLTRSHGRLTMALTRRPADPNSDHPPPPATAMRSTTRALRALTKQTQAANNLARNNGSNTSLIGRTASAPAAAAAAAGSRLLPRRSFSSKPLPTTNIVARYEKFGPVDAVVKSEQTRSLQRTLRIASAVQAMSPIRAGG